MNRKPEPDQEGPPPAPRSLLQNLRQRGVLRVGFSYAVIAWLLLQIGDVVLEPLGAPGWVMRALIAVVATGFPIALLLAWLFEITPRGVEFDTLPEGAPRPTVRGIRHYADAVIIAVLLATVAFLLFRQSDWIAGERGPPVIGVLPFTAQGGQATGPDDEWFGAGLADTLSYKLGLLQQLIVLAPSSTLEFRDPGLDLKVVGARLGATALLEGTVRRSGATLRINARLVDIISGRQLWSGSYDRSSSDLFAVQDEIAAAVTEALQVVLSPQDESRLAQPMTSSLSAYDAYLKAQVLLAERDWDKMLPAVNHMREATRLDPNYALAWSGLVHAMFLAVIYNPAAFDWAEISDEAHSAAARAKALDPRLGDAYLAEAMVAILDNQSQAGVAWPEDMIRGLLQRARELSPNDANIPYMQAQGAASWEERTALLEQSARLDPQSGVVLSLIAKQYFDAGETGQGIAWAMRAAAVENPPVGLVYGQLVHANLYDLGQLSEAARWALAFQRLAPKDFLAYVSRIVTLNELGAAAQAQAMLGSLPRGEGPFADRDIWRVVELAHGARAARARGDLPGAAALARRFSVEVLEPLGLWPDISQAPEPFLPVLDVWAVADLWSGNPAEALERYRRAYPDPALMPYWNSLADPLRAPVLFAVLHRMTGDPGTAETLLREALVSISDEPITGENGIGYTRFFIHAFLGETEQALVALREATDAGWLVGWWGLRSGDFDPTFARVTADPRFGTLQAKIEQRVARMREDFFAHPELPALEPAP